MHLYSFVNAYDGKDMASRFFIYILENNKLPKTLP